MASFVAQLKDMFFVLVERVTGFGREEEEPKLHVVQRVGHASKNPGRKVGDADDETSETGGSSDGIHVGFR
ncbi:hypothetical protein ACP70R_010406 [Stipagrostis hirtigluma subsp. patula]